MWRITEISDETVRFSCTSDLVNIRCRNLRVDDGLDLIIHDKHQRATNATKNVGEGALEESVEAFLLVNLDERIDRAVVQLLALARVHHQTTTNGVKGVRENTSRVGGDLRDDELEDEGGVLGEESALTGVVETEVSATIHDDTLDRDAETLVESHRTRPAGNLGQAVNQAGEFAGRLATNVGSEAGTSEVKRVDDEQRAGTGQTTRRHVDGEERPEVRARVVLREQVLNRVLEREVERLRREITHDVGEVTSPEGGETLFGGDAREAVDDAGVSRHFAGHDARVRVLRLDEQLNALDRGRRGLRDGAGNTTLQSFERARELVSTPRQRWPDRFDQSNFHTHRRN